MIQQEYLGLGTIQQLEPTLADLSAEKVFLVMEDVSYSASGAREYVESTLSSYKITTHCGFAVNPNVDDLDLGITAFKDTDADVVIAVGGGSVIDMAKMINYFGCGNCNPRAYLLDGEKCSGDSRPLIAIPTTSGTGSQATHFAVLYIDRVKHSVAAKSILPDVAIVDPNLTLSMPARLTAVTGMDALSQAIESYWCVNSNDEAKEHAAEAIKMINANLELAVTKSCKDTSSAMALAAHLAGKAINITKTTAPHAVSYPLTSYFGIPHGHAVALTLAAMLEFNAGATEEDTLDPRGHAYVRETIEEIVYLLGEKDVLAGKKAIEYLMDQIGLERELGKLGIGTNKEIELIIQNSFNPDRVKNNPRKLSEETLRDILYRIA